MAAAEASRRRQQGQPAAWRVRVTCSTCQDIISAQEQCATFQPLCQARWLSHPQQTTICCLSAAAAGFHRPVLPGARGATAQTWPHRQLLIDIMTACSAVDERGEVSACHGVPCRRHRCSPAKPRRCAGGHLQAARCSAITSVQQCGAAQHVDHRGLAPFLSACPAPGRAGWRPAGGAAAGGSRKAAESEGANQGRGCSHASRAGGG